MQCLKVIFLLIPGVFSCTGNFFGLPFNTSWMIQNTSSFTVRQGGIERIAFELSYSSMGKNFTEFSGYFSAGEERTINIPQGATNPQICACYTEDRPCQHDISWGPIFEPTRCITLYHPYNYKTQAKCKPRPTKGYSITVRQVGDYKSLFELQYSYNYSKEFRSSGEISNGQSKTIRIPDGATNIRFTHYVYNTSQSSKHEVFSRLYEDPVRKCFEARNPYFENAWVSFEKICESPTDTNNSISVHQTSDSKMQIIVHYFNIEEFDEMWEVSDEFSKGETRSIQIPNESLNIWVILRWRDSNGAIKTHQIAKYDSPVIRCFKTSISSDSAVDWSEESCPKHSQQ